MSKAVTIKDALQRVADNPVPATDELIQLPVHELVCRALFEIANNPDQSQRGSLNRANKARNMIFNRLVGKRRAGSHPATRTPVTLDFIDLTGQEVTNGQPEGVQHPDRGGAGPEPTEGPEGP